MTQNATLDELLSKKPSTRTAYFIVDSDLADRWQEAKRRVDELKRYGATAEDLREAEELVEELRPLVKDATRAITFKSLGRVAFRELLDKHPPTKEQRKDARENGIGEIDHNPETFPPALIAASAISPEMTLEQAEELWNSDNYNSGELALLQNTALAVNSASSVLSLGKEYEKTQG